MSPVSPSVSPIRGSRSLSNSSPQTPDIKSPLFHWTSTPESLPKVDLNASKLNGSRASTAPQFVNTPVAVPPLTLPSSCVTNKINVNNYSTNNWITYTAIMTGGLIPIAVVAWGVTSLFISIFFPPLHFAIIGVIILIFVSRLACSYYQRCHVIEQINDNELFISLSSPLATMSKPALLTPVDFLKNFNEFFFYSNYSLVHADAV